MADMPSLQFSTAVDSSVGGGGRVTVPVLQLQGGRGQAGVIEPSRWGDTGNIGSEIPELLNDLFKPKLDQLKQQKFWDGFTQARAAGTAEQIQKDQPWYSRVFGPTPYELGADTFAVQKATADVETKFNESLPSLRMLPPEEVGRALNEMSADAMTGDPYTDSLIQKNMLDRAGPMMEAHTKARYAWQQQELATGQFNAQQSAGTAYQTAMVAAAKLGKDHPDQLPSPESVRDMTRNLLQTFQMSENQDPKAGMASMVSSIGQLADDNKWYAVNAIQDSGVLAHLPTDVQDHIQTRIDRASARSQMRVYADPEMSRLLANITSQMRTGRLSPEKTLDVMQAANEKWAALSGNRDNPIYPMDKIVGGVATSAELVYRAEDALAKKAAAAQEKAATAAEKEAAQARTDAVLVRFTATGSLGDAVARGQATKEDADRAFMAHAASSPASVADIAVANASAPTPFISPTLKAQLTNAVDLAAGQQYTDGFGKTYDEWQSIRYHQQPVDDQLTQQPVMNSDGTPKMVNDPNGYGAARLLYGPETMTRMQRFHEMVKAGIPREAAYQKTFGAESDYGNANLQGLDSTETQANVAAVQSVVDEHGDRWFSPDMPDAAKRVLTQVVGREFQAVKNNAPEMSADAAAKTAFNIAVQEKGLNVSGKYVWTDGANQKSLPQYLHMTQQDGFTPREEFDRVFDKVLTEKFHKSGIDIGSDTDYNVVRIGDDAHGPQLFAMAYEPDGTFKSVWFTGEDLQQVQREISEEKIKSLQARTIRGTNPKQQANTPLIDAVQKFR